VTNREFCVSRRKIEYPTFVRVLKALPAGRLDYRPDPKSRNAAELAWTIACEEADLLTILETGRVEYEEKKPPASPAEILAAYERSAAAASDRMAKLDEAAWERKGQFLVQGQVAWEDTIGGFAWGFLFDAVHHRGQLTTYLRPMGGKVPSIYGPSADDPGQ
jgi:uncharacterized damage-inducible protein DinB